MVDFGQSLGKCAISPSFAGVWFLRVTSRSMLAGGRGEECWCVGWISRVGGRLGFCSSGVEAVDTLW